MGSLSLHAHVPMSQAPDGARGIHQDTKQGRLQTCTRVGIRVTLSEPTTPIRSPAEVSFVLPWIIMVISAMSFNMYSEYMYTHE